MNRYFLISLNAFESSIQSRVVDFRWCHNVYRDGDGSILEFLEDDKLQGSLSMREPGYCPQLQFPRETGSGPIVDPRHDSALGAVELRGTHLWGGVSSGFGCQYSNLRAEGDVLNMVLFEQ